MLNQLMMFGCCMSVNMLVMSFAALIRQAPALIDHVRRFLRFILILSYRLYRGVLSRLAPILYRLTRIDLLSRWPRVVSALSLSLLIGAGFHLLLGLVIGLWGIGVFAVHGLLVGSLWDELNEPGGIRLGERL